MVMPVIASSKTTSGNLSKSTNQLIITFISSFEESNFKGTIEFESDYHLRAVNWKVL